MFPARLGERQPLPADVRCAETSAAAAASPEGAPTTFFAVKRRTMCAVTQQGSPQRKKLRCRGSLPMVVSRSYPQGGRSMPAKKKAAKAKKPAKKATKAKKKKTAKRK